MGRPSLLMGGRFPRVRATLEVKPADAEDLAGSLCGRVGRDEIENRKSPGLSRRATCPALFMDLLVATPFP
jgi:hypothetical protein